MPLRVTNVTRDRILADRAREATGFRDRLVGLLGRRELPIGEGLHLLPCNSIHMFFMRFPIDAIFLDAGGTVVKVFHALAPWRATSVYRKARSVLELPAGVAKESGTQVGDCLAFERLKEGRS